MTVAEVTVPGVRVRATRAGRHLAGVRGRVTLTVLVVTTALYSLLGTLLFIQVVRSGRQSIEDRIGEVLDQLEAEQAAGRVAVSIETADGVTARITSADGVPDARPGEVQITRPVPSAVGAADTGAAVLVGTASTRNLNHSLRPLHRALWVGVPAAAVFTAAVAGAATGRALRPVDDISRLAARIGPGADDQRVPVPATDDEIRHLALTVNRMLDRISDGRRAADRFTTDAAHELRTPLMALQGELELSARGLGDDASVARMQAQSTRLAELVDDLVLLSGLHEGRPLSPEPVDMAELVRAEAGTAAPGAELVVPGGPPALVAAGDRRLLARAVRNLLTNAHRHAGARVVVTVQAADDRAEVVVDDDGPGVSEHQRAAVFERFTRLDEARSADAGGSGLGLAIVAGVAAAHDGTVTVDRSPLGGARFTLRLPLV